MGDRKICPPILPKVMSTALGCSGSKSVPTPRSARLAVRGPPSFQVALREIEQGESEGTGDSHVEELESLHEKFINAGTTKACGCAGREWDFMEGA